MISIYVVRFSRVFRRFRGFVHVSYSGNDAQACVEASFDTRSRHEDVDFEGERRGILLQVLGGSVLRIAGKLINEYA